MTGLLDQTENLADVPAPLVEDFIVGLLLLEGDNARRSVNPGIYRLVRDEFT